MIAEEKQTMPKDEQMQEEHFKKANTAGEQTMQDESNKADRDGQADEPRRWQKISCRHVCLAEQQSRHYYYRKQE